MKMPFFISYFINFANFQRVMSKNTTTIHNENGCGRDTLTAKVNNQYL